VTSHEFNGVRGIARDFEELQDTALKPSWDFERFHRFR